MPVSLDHNITGRCHYLEHNVSLMMLPNRPNRTTERRNSGNNHFLLLVNLDKQVESQQCLVMGFCVVFTTFTGRDSPMGSHFANKTSRVRDFDLFQCCTWHEISLYAYSKKTQSQRSRQDGQLFKKIIFPIITSSGICLPWVVLPTFTLPGGSDYKNLPVMEDIWVWSWVRNIPGERNGYSLQYCCLENSMDRGAWWAWGHKELDTTE